MTKKEWYKCKYMKSPIGVPMCMNPKKQPYNPGSASGTTQSNKNEVKEFYTFEESPRFTKKDFDNNPELFKAVERSMQKWGK